MGMFVFETGNHRLGAFIKELTPNDPLFGNGTNSKSRVQDTSVPFLWNRIENFCSYPCGSEMPFVAFNERATPFSAPAQ